MYHFNTLNESKDKHHVTTILTCPIFYKKQRFLKTEKTSYTPQFLFYILRNILEIKIQTTLSEKRKVFLIKTFFFFPKYLHCNISLGSVFLRIPIESIKNQIGLKK